MLNIDMAALHVCSKVAAAEPPGIDLDQKRRASYACRIPAGLNR